MRFCPPALDTRRTIQASSSTASCLHFFTVNSTQNLRVCRTFARAACTNLCVRSLRELLRAQSARTSARTVCTNLQHQPLQSRPVLCAILSHNLLHPWAPTTPYFAQYCTPLPAPHASQQLHHLVADLLHAGVAGAVLVVLLRKHAL